MVSLSYAKDALAIQMKNYTFQYKYVKYLVSNYT